MALSFEIRRSLHGADIVDDYFKVSWEAEKSRQEEYDSDVKLQSRIRGHLARLKLKKQIAASINLQRIFRGFKARKFVKAERERMELKAKLAFWNQKVTLIQKIWRGFKTRKSHDFYGRKKYLADLVVKMEQTRLSIEAHEKAQMEALVTRQRDFDQKLLRKLAGQRHHLVGTRAIPGVMRKFNEPLLTHSYYIQDGEDSCKRVLDEQRIVKLPPLSQLPEKELKESEELKNWIHSTVGKNYRGIRVKPAPLAASSKPISLEKRAQGPFLPKTLLEKKKGKPLKPTLRVETDFYDTYNYWKNERLKESTLRITDQRITTNRFIHHKSSEYLLRQSPYKLIQTFRDVEKYGKDKMFKNVTAPAPLFEDMMDY
ncbi:spermatogenesis-associated protein 17 [Chytriomyces hyalinus]|nr:spermatogenesis-associated protein 17 [Chytriomyces hyalinus]